MMKQDTDYMRILVAIMLAGLVLVSWQALVEYPRRQQIGQIVAQKSKVQDEQQAKTAAKLAQRDAESEDNLQLSRQERLTRAPRVTISSDKLHGSIALKGARIDDLTLAKYRVTQEPDSPEVTLLSPHGDQNAYFAQIGWLSADNTVKVPDQNTIWQADKAKIGAGDSVNLRWDNGAGVTFILAVSLDENYMFTINQRVQNHSGHNVQVIPYAYINRVYSPESGHMANAILHEGPLGVMEGALEEIPYDDLREKGNREFENATGWFGITDKYWLTALIPGQDSFKATFSHYSKGGRDRYQIDYLGKAVGIENGNSSDMNLRLFAGAKEIQIIDQYADGDSAKRIPPIALFDRSVDFGSLYFLTKPMFLMLNFFFTHIGNFGVAILLLTIVVKLLLFPLANKSFKAMAKMRVLQPEMIKIRERYVDDQIAMQKEMMALYKREKVNPASGCLPILIQMPVFFALYKVLYVTIEMRHAPFFGWLKDLSALDPSNLFTLFGLLDWNHPSWMHLGVLPMLMCATMVIQMKQQPPPPDPVQAKMMAYMPYFFLFIFASFPAGLVLYWTWSNVLSILQQHVISRKYKSTQPAAEKKA